jgi:serine O-acetyltransferase
MLDHIHAMDQRMQAMCESIRRLGGEVPDLSLPELGPCDIDPNRPPAPERTKAEPEKIVD